MKITTFQNGMNVQNLRPKNITNNNFVVVNLDQDIDNEIVKTIYENDAESLSKLLSRLPYSFSNRITSAYFSLLPRSDTVSLQSRSGRLSDKNLTLLHIAAYYDSTESFFTLIEFFKSSGQNEDQIFYARTSESYYPLHYALINRSYEIANFIINRVPDQIHKIDDGVRYYPITLAVIGGMTNFLEYLFKITAKNPLPTNQINQAYDMALGIGEYPCLKLLIQNKNPNSTKLRDETIQMKAVANCLPNVVSLVLMNEHDNLDAIFYKNKEADSLLRRLLTYDPPKFKEQIKQALELMEVDQQRVDPDKFHRTKGVCHWMCYFCDVEIAEMLVSKFSVDINRVDDNFQTGPFMMTRDDLTEKQIIDMLNFLIDNKFDLNYMSKGTNGKLRQKTVLEFFVTSKKRLDVIRFLLEKNANPDAPTFVQGGINGTIRDYVRKKKSKDMNDIFDQFPKKE